eukprot:TRINITY_DN8352_c0_g1_i1.p1 TRINITY_DN8352_c0_g1~~TRINITY_DN8352_c0_g1_i1.p1  ORF type:complete len:288 (-),score=8.23 TRINITY_DN8352_c0_g1_i1:138-1001(-)
MSSRAQCVKQWGFLYVIALLSFISLSYVAFVYLTVIDLYKIHLKTIILLVIFHLFFLLFIFSFLKTATMNPGKVPGYMRLQMQGPRFCQHCKFTKPERCHHCSICQECVLVMDHHCPWVGNCIGYNNKKIFLLMIAYVLMTLFTTIFGEGYAIYVILRKLINKGAGEGRVEDWLILVSFVANVITFFVIGSFFRYHINLVSKNSTTLESLDALRGRPKQNYGVSEDENWKLVCGPAKWSWPLPCFGLNGLPEGYAINQNAAQNQSSYPGTPIAPRGNNPYGGGYSQF